MSSNSAEPVALNPRFPELTSGMPCEPASDELPHFPTIEKLGSFERQAISEPVRQWLCHFAAGELHRQMPDISPDWEELFQAVCRNGLVGLAQAYLSRHPASHPPATFRRWIAFAHLLAVQRMTRTLKHVESVLGAISAAGLEALVLKGPALAELVYPDRSLRWYGDLDIHVRERDLAAVHALLLSLGLQLDGEHVQSPPRLVSQAPGAEWHYFTPDGWLGIELHGDDLLHTGLVPRDYEGLWARAVDFKLRDIPLKALSLEDQLIALSAHVHYHGYTRLNWLSDIAFIVRDRCEDLDWERLITIVQTEDVQVPVYYTFYFLETMLGVAVPETVLARLRPDAFRRCVHELYMPEDKVVGMQPMPRPDFSFYFLPLFKRLIPDLLVMGRRTEKLHYLLRLLAPSPAWLRHYYGVQDREGVARHYVLHPLKLAAHYVASVATAISWLWHPTHLDDGGSAHSWWSVHPRMDSSHSCH